MRNEDQGFEGEFGDAEDITDLEDVKPERVRRFNWDRFADGKTHWVTIAKSKRASFRVQAKRAGRIRGVKFVTRWDRDKEREVDGEVVGRMLLQAKPLG